MKIGMIGTDCCGGMSRPKLCDDDETIGGGVFIEDIDEDDEPFFVALKGFGDNFLGDEGYPVSLSQVDGEMKLFVWSDINNSEPTHIISLEGARIEKKKND